VHPKSLEELIKILSELPSLGPKSAERIALHLLEKPQKAEQIIKAMKNLGKIGYCEKCNSFTEGKVCAICENPQREKNKICVVEEPHQVDIIEKSGIFKGLYYVLHGSVAPLEGKNPQDLKVNKLVKRIKEGHIKEIILATNEEFTLHYMVKLLKNLKVKVSCLAKGIPVGGNIEYVDELTLREAFKGRQEV
jgi:recombination protein RecR